MRFKAQRRKPRKMLLHGLGGGPEEFNRSGTTKEKKFIARI